MLIVADLETITSPLWTEHWETFTRNAFVENCLAGRLRCDLTDTLEQDQCMDEIVEQVRQYIKEDRAAVHARGCEVSLSVYTGCEADGRV